MFRSLVRLVAAVALLAVACAGSSAAPVPGVAYDESVRFSGVTDPARALGPAFGAFAEALAAAANGRLERYTFWNGWLRIEDVAEHRATIYRCDEDRVIRLDLARRTFRVETPDADPTPSPAPRGRRAGPPGWLAAGTAAVAAEVTTRSLEPRVLTGTATARFTETTRFDVTAAGGSCGEAPRRILVERTVDAGDVPLPSLASCPLRPRYPEAALNAIAAPQSGCRPSVTARKSGPPIPAGRLALSTALSVDVLPPAAAGEADPPAQRLFTLLRERTNLRPIDAADAPLFEIPSGFTREP